MTDPNDELPNDVQADIADIIIRYNDEDRHVTVGDVAVDDGQRYRLELHGPSGVEDHSEWMNPDEFSRYIDGITMAVKLEREINIGP